MSKALVYKALSLLDDDVEQDKLPKKKADSKVKQKKTKQKLHKPKVTPFHARSKGVLDNSLSMDRTEENIKLLMQLKALKPKSSVAQKIVEQLYTKPTNSVEEFEEKSKKQKSILFDDDDDEDDSKDKKKRKKQKYDVDSW